MKTTIEKVEERAQEKEGSFNRLSRRSCTIATGVDNLEQLRGDHEDVTAKL